MPEKCLIWIKMKGQGFIFHQSGYDDNLAEELWSGGRVRYTIKDEGFMQERSEPIFFLKVAKGALRGSCNR
jgi:hypothetical protein